LRLIPVLVGLTINRLKDEAVNSQCQCVIPHLIHWLTSLSLSELIIHPAAHQTSPFSNSHIRFRSIIAQQNLQFNINSPNSWREMEIRIRHTLTALKWMRTSVLLIWVSRNDWDDVERRNIREVWDFSKSLDVNRLLLKSTWDCVCKPFYWHCLKVWGLLLVSSVHQGCIYVFKNIINCEILLQF